MTRAQERSEQIAVAGLEAPAGRGSQPARCESTAGGYSPPSRPGCSSFSSIYATWRAFENAHYFSEPYLSPFYSPCLTDKCPSEAQDLGQWALVGWWPLSPALMILIFPLGFRLTCYYYRKAYYRSFWASPPACAVAEPHEGYSGETRFPLIVQNIHRYFLYVAMLFARAADLGRHPLLPRPERRVGSHGPRHGDPAHQRGPDLGLHAVLPLVPAHTSAAGCKHFSAHPVRYRAWTLISKLNARHMLLAWASLVWLVVADFYIRCLATGAFSDPRFF